MTEVLRRAKIPKDSTSAGSKNTEKDKSAKDTNGTPTGSQALNGNNAIALSKEWSGGPDGLPDVRIPEITVELGVDFLKERIKDCVEPVEEEDDDSD